MAAPAVFPGAMLSGPAPAPPPTWVGTPTTGEGTRPYHLGGPAATWSMAAGAAVGMPGTAGVDFLKRPVLVAAAAGVAAGLVTAAIWAALASVTGALASPLAAIVGIAVGIAVRRGRRAGADPGVALVAGLVAAVSIAMGGLFSGVGVISHSVGSNLFVGLATLDRSYLPVLWHQAGVPALAVAIAGVLVAVGLLLVPRLPGIDPS